MTRSTAIHFIATLSTALLFALGCGDDAGGGPDGGEPLAPRMRLDPEGDSFYAMPYPNDLRFDQDTGTVDLTGFPNPGSNDLVPQMLQLASEGQSGFSLVPVAFLSFEGPIAADRLLSDWETVPQDEGLAFFVNVEPGHPRYGERVPAVTAWYADGGTYVDPHTLTMAPWPGRSLAPGAAHAAVLLAEVGAPDGRPLTPHPSLEAALQGETPAGPQGAALEELYAPLAAYLQEATDLEPASVGAATVFTTGTPAAELQALVDQAVQRFDAEVADPLALTYGDDPAFCFLEGTIRLPQFQAGDAPFSEPGSGGLVLDAQGELVTQWQEEMPFVLVVPKGVTMPAAGFPYMEFVHGSGGVATQVIDRGPVTVEGGENTPWRGPGWIAAQRGFASGGHAMPISPDRVPDAASFDYLQVTNLGSLRGNFLQGTIELALKKELLDGLTLDATACPGADVPGGTIAIDPDVHATMGQSMGAMYVNMLGAVSGETDALIPTGSGGYWSFFLFSTELIPGAGSLLQTVLGVPSTSPFSHLHPLMGLFQQYIDPVDPIVLLPRLVTSPLPGVPAKHLYVPFGRDDIFFSTETQRAMGIGYGVPLVGDEVIEGTRSHLEAFHDFDPVTYPASGNLQAGDGSTVTAMQVQYPPDPIQQNGHYVVFQHPEPKHQYGCFLESLAAAGTPVVPEGSTSDPLAACP